MRIDIRPAAPNQINGLKAIGDVLIITLNWTVPTDENYRAAQVYMNTVNDFNSATLYNIVGGNHVDVPVKDTAIRYFWVRAVDKWGNSNGAVTGPVTATAKLVTTSQIGVFDLATANIINKLSVANITGLGALATISSIDARTQVNYLGNLAYANAIYAEDIGAGTLAAGVIYAGTISAEKVTAGTLTGQTIQTATGGQRIVINSGNNNMLEVYGMDGSYAGAFGGASGTLFAKGITTAPAIYAIAASGSAILSSGDILVIGDVNADIGNFDSISTGNSSGNAITINGGGNGIVQNGGGANWLKTLNPISDNTYSLGSSGDYRWTALYASSSTITTSDASTKTDVRNSDLGLDFVMKLRPVKYKQIVAERVEVEVPAEPVDVGPPAPSTTELQNRAGQRNHYGFIAQEVKQAIVDSGIQDAAFWVLSDPADPNSKQALRYEELIAPMAKAIQELKQEVDALKAMLASK